MNKIALVLLVAVVVIGAIGCAPKADTNVNAGLTTNRNAAPEPVNTASIEAEIKKLEAEWSAAANSKNVEAVKRILADDIVLTYPDGSTGTKTSEIELVETGAITADSWDVSENKVTVLNAEAAFITGRAAVKNGKLKDPKTQQVIDISGEYRFLDVFAKRAGKWQAVASHVTRIQALPPGPTKTQK